MPSQPMTNTPTNLQIRIISPKQDVQVGEAVAVSSNNSDGPFDILPQHANFVTLVENHPIIIIRPDQQKVTYQFPFAIIYAAKNKVRIYTDIQVTI